MAFDVRRPYSHLPEGKLEAARQNSYTRLVRHHLTCSFGCTVEVAVCTVGRDLQEQAVLDDAAARLG